MVCFIESVCLTRGPLNRGFAVIAIIILDQVAQRLISIDPRLNFNLGSYIPLFKSFFQIIVSLLFKASYYKIID